MNIILVIGGLALSESGTPVNAPSRPQDTTPDADKSGEGPRSINRKGKKIEKQLARYQRRKN